MAEQQWFAGVPVVAQRQLDQSENERLDEFAGDVWREALTSYFLLLVAVAFVVASTLVNLTTFWLGPLTLSVTSAVLRYLPNRRFFSVPALLKLRRDRMNRLVFVCKTEDVTIEIFINSHLVWSRNGLPVERPVIAHASVTATAPEHAAMAANFVRPIEESEELFIHQRALTADELSELDSYAPRPEFAVIVLAVVGLAGAMATFALALTGRLHTLWQPTLFLLIAGWAGWSIWRARQARKRIGPDIETGYVVIVRSIQDGQLGPAQEILPHSHIVWSEGGETAEWRKYIRRRHP